MTKFNSLRICRTLIRKGIGLGTILISASLLVGCFAYKESSATEVHNIERLDPKAVVSLYWASALVGDTDTIRKISGLPYKKMLWDCPPKSPPTNSKGSSSELPKIDPEFDERLNKPIDLIESILTKARVIMIARKELDSHYDLAEYKSFGSEARLLYRPKDSPNSTNSTMFFLLKQEGGWRIVDVMAESQLYYVGNKKFGEQRDCPE